MRAGKSLSQCSTVTVWTASVRVAHRFLQESLSPLRPRKLPALQRRMLSVGARAVLQRAAFVLIVEHHFSHGVKRFRNSCPFASRPWMTIPGSSPCWISGLHARSLGRALIRRFLISPIRPDDSAHKWLLLNSSHAGGRRIRQADGDFMDAGGRATQDAVAEGGRAKRDLAAFLEEHRPHPPSGPSPAGGRRNKAKSYYCGPNQ